MRMLKLEYSVIVSLLFMLNGTLAAQEDAKTCLECHRRGTPGVVAQWEASRHGEAGIECEYCHGADKGQPDAFEHYGNLVSVIVSPKDCAQCHEREYSEQSGSHHAMAGEILGSLDNLLGEVIGGEPAVVVGCRQCHGSEVRVDSTGHPTSDTWPNTGMGRINPDSSRGSCAACHVRHTFSVAQARQPEACGKCHLGPDHPQTEVWNESKHGVTYHANREKMNLDARAWRAGKEYYSGPTCSSCHMSAAGSQKVTHDVGERISWTLRPPVSTRISQVRYADGLREDIPGDAPQLPSSGGMYKSKSGAEKKVDAVLPWKERREKMQDVCAQCHAGPFVVAFYKQFDDLVGLYNDKFALPGQAIMNELRSRKLISAADFDDPIEWTWYELWHHEGRRARHGASMMGPDYAWWHGIYEVAKHFYGEFIPQVREEAGEELAKQLLEKHVYSQDGHLWHRDGFSPEVRRKIEQFYRERYR